ncbi:hypothetical protein CAPTEDRAFT_187859, partial [Capitella teleta]
GVKGVKGLKGVGGPPGAFGPQGLSGNPGLDGDKGVRGPPGNLGARGPPGDMGEKGDALGVAALSQVEDSIEAFGHILRSTAINSKKAIVETMVGMTALLVILCAVVILVAVYVCRMRRRYRQKVNPMQVAPDFNFRDKSLV